MFSIPPICSLFPFLPSFGLIEYILQFYFISFVASPSTGPKEGASAQPPCSPTTDFPPRSRSQKCRPKLSVIPLHSTAVSNRGRSKACLMAQGSSVLIRQWEWLPNQEALDILAPSRARALALASLEMFTLSGDVYLCPHSPTHSSQPRTSRCLR